MMLWKCCTQYASRFGKLSSGHRTEKGQFSFQSPKKATPKIAQTTTWLHSCHVSAGSFQFSCSVIWLFVTPWTAAHQACLSITNSWSLLKLMSIESVIPFNHLILWHPLLLLSSIFPINRGFSIESVLRIRWPKYWSFSISPSVGIFRTDLL